MRTLRVGSTGSDVEAWEHFLVGRDPFSAVVADGTFDAATEAATRKFQSEVGFTFRDVDGVVGPGTFGKAMQLGFDPLDDDDPSDDGPNWPEPQAGVQPLPLQDRVRIFGQFNYRANPTPGNPEGIAITDSWAQRSIVTVDVPQLARLGAAKVSFHRLGAAQLQKLFSDWEQAGLIDRVISWDGAWAPRFIRGSRTTLSNHAWATAFDINARWNPLGARPALKGFKGCTRELVDIAVANGFFWGGHFKTRPDGMHFELREVITP